MSALAIATSVSTRNDGLTPQQEQAALLQAECELGVEQIAERVGVTRMTLWRWNQERAFRERVRQINADLDAEAYRTALARKRNRVLKLAEMANHLEGQIRRSRKASPFLVWEWRGLYEQIARELGQWSDKLDLSGEVEVRKIEIREVVIEVPREPADERDEAAARTATEAAFREVTPESALPPAPPNAYTPKQLNPAELGELRGRGREDWS